jgi:DNA-binding CsgD family transcriptional regulator
MRHVTRRLADARPVRSLPPVRTRSPRGTPLKAADVLALYSAASLDDFIDQAFRVLRTAVRCDYVSVFYQRAGHGFMRERDSHGRTWGDAFMRRYLELTPAIPYVLANRGVRILATRFALTDSEAELRASAFYREVMQPQGWRHGAVLCFWAGRSSSFPMFVLSVYRPEGQRDFSDAELMALESLHPFLAPAIARFHQISTSNAVSEGIATALRLLPRGIVVLDEQLRTIRTNPAGRRSCAEWNGVSSGRLGGRPPAIPPSLLRVCRQLRDELTSAMRRRGDSGARRRRHVAHPRAPGLLASVTAICRATALAEPCFVIEFEQDIRQSAPADDLASRLSTLTRSEREVALVVAEGLSNQEAAERLGKTIHAVKFLLHRVYRRLQVPNRARLSLLLHGTPAHAEGAP